MTILDKLDELQKIADAATSGPWTTVSSLPVYAVSAKAEFGHYDVVTASGREYARYASGQKHGSKREDADFIATSRTAVPQLIAALRVALTEIQAWSCICDSHHQYTCEKCEILARIAELLEVRGWVSISASSVAVSKTPPAAGFGVALRRTPRSLARSVRPVHRLDLGTVV